MLTTPPPPSAVGDPSAKLSRITQFLMATTPPPADETRSGAIQRTLFVNVDDVTSLARLPGGELLAGTAGGGIAEWSSDHQLAALGTSLEGLPSSHVRDLLLYNGTVKASTRAGLAERQGPGNWSVIALGLDLDIRLLRGGKGRAVAVTSEGSLFHSADGRSWSQFWLPALLPRDMVLMPGDVGCLLLGH